MKKGKPRLTAKQHAFAVAMASGKYSQADAYRLTYNADKSTGQTVRNEASKLMTHPDVASTIKTLKGRIEAACAASAVSDREIVLAKLRLMVESALPSDSMKIRAAELLGRSVGLFKDVIETKEHRTAEEILADIDARLESDEYGDDAYAEHGADELLH